MPGNQDSPEFLGQQAMRVRGTCVALAGHGVLLRGGSGSGKSDLALRLMDAGGELVSDDYTDLRAEDGQLVATSPPALSGLLEVRGLGVVSVPARPAVAVLLVVDLVAASGLERMPIPETETILGIDISVFRMTAFEISAVAKIHIILRLVLRSIILVE